MNWKNIITKSTSLLLIAVGLYHVLFSLKSILFTYPHLVSELKSTSIFVQEGLIEKALVLYATMLIDGTYGTVLLLKPDREVKPIHIAAGILIAVISIFFVTPTPFTANPMIDLVSRLTS